MEDCIFCKIIKGEIPSNKVFENEYIICGVDKSGYRVVTNVGRDAGQSVLHLHFHVLGGRPFMNDMSTPNAGCEEH